METNQYLYESNIKGSLSEALTAHIDVVLSDDGGRVGCDDKKKNNKKIKRCHLLQKSANKCALIKQKLTAHSAAAGTLGAKHLLRVRIQQSLSSHCSL